jgi:hypothetical protein
MSIVVTLLAPMARSAGRLPPTCTREVTTGSITWASGSWIGLTGRE